MDVISLVRAFGSVESVSTPGALDEVLPAGFHSYFCIVHAEYNSTGQRIWCDAASRRPAISAVGEWRGNSDAREDRSDWSEGRLDAVSAVELVRVLGLEDFGRYGWTRYLDEQNPLLGTGADLRRLLTNEAKDGPLLWFPLDLQWIASTPYDEEMTYIAVDANMAKRLLASSVLELATI